MEQILSVEQVAELLQVDVAAVLSVIKRGQLPSLLLGDAVRVRRADLEAYVDEAIRSRQLEAVARMLRDPRAWAKQLDTDPTFKAEILGSDPEPGTMGAFLKEAATASDAERAAGNVVDLHGPRRK